MHDKQLARAREEGRYRRHYVAVAHGAPAPARGVWTGAIGRARDPRRRRSMAATRFRAETAYAVVASTAHGELARRRAPNRAHPPDSRARRARAAARFAGTMLTAARSRIVSRTRRGARAHAHRAPRRMGRGSAWTGEPLRVEARHPRGFRRDLGRIAVALRISWELALRRSIEPSATKDPMRPSLSLPLWLAAAMLSLTAPRSRRAERRGCADSRWCCDRSPTPGPPGRVPSGPHAPRHAAPMGRRSRLPVGGRHLRRRPPRRAGQGGRPRRA